MTVCLNKGGSHCSGTKSSFFFWPIYIFNLSLLVIYCFEENERKVIKKNRLNSNKSMKIGYLAQAKMMNINILSDVSHSETDIKVCI